MKSCAYRALVSLLTVWLIMGCNTFWHGGESPAVEVRGLVEGWREAAVQRNLDGFMFMYADDYSDSLGGTQEAIRADVGNEMKEGGGFDYLQIDLSVATAEEQGTTVLFGPILLSAPDSPDDIPATELRQTFERRDGSWKLVFAEFALAEE